MSTDTPPSTADIPDWVASYLDPNDRAWAAQIRRRRDALSPREQRLVEEAAIMGYMLGMFSERDGRRTIPRDAEVVNRVIGGCITMGDRFPTIYRAGSRPRQRR